MRKSGDRVFVISKYINTENSFAVEVRTRVLKTRLDDEDAWWVENIYGTAKGKVSEKDMFDSNEEAIQHALRKR